MVANALQKKGIEVYCPLMKKQRQWSDRAKIVEVPLFKSYCFVNLREEERSLVFGVSGVVRYLFWLKKPAIVKQAEIDIIKDMLNDFDHSSIEVVSLAVADRIRIDSGAFIDHEAEVVSTQGQKIIAKIDSLGICIAIDKSKNKIKKIQAIA